MLCKLLDLTGDQVDQLAEEMEEAGFYYDIDYTALYGAGWETTGVQFMNYDAALYGLNKAQDFFEESE